VWNKLGNKNKAEAWSLTDQTQKRLWTISANNVRSSITQNIQKPSKYSIRNC
jgi:hypothetical protein